MSSNWCTIQLDQCAEIQTGVAKGRKLDGGRTVTLPYLRVANVQDGYLDLSDIKYIELRQSEVEQYRLQPGDVVVTEGGDFDKLGRGFIWNGQIPGCVHQNHIFAVRPDHTRLLPEFLAYLIQSRYGKAYFLSVAHKTTNLACINSTKLKAFPVLLPPLPEQHAIAHVLRTVQDAIQARRREVELERERKAALMQHLFTHGTQGEPTKQTEIGEMPESWQVVQLGDIFEAQLGKMLSPKARVGTSPRPYVRNANVQWGHVDVSDVLEMDFDEAEQRKFRLKRNDILVCEGGEVGRTAIWREEMPDCYFQKAIHRLRPRDGQMLPTFFLHHMERAFRFANLYGVAGTETTIAHLPQEKLTAMRIPAPALDEQQTMAAVLDRSDAAIAALEHELVLHEELFGALLDELVTGRLSTLPLIEASIP